MQAVGCRGQILADAEGEDADDDGREARRSPARRLRIEFGDIEAHAASHEPDASAPPPT